MAEDSKKKDNAFSKAIGALRAEKEDFLEQQIEDARRKEEEDKKEYAYWLKKSQEILVEDCLEAIGTISGEDIAKGGKTVTFSSEAFLWFKENRSPITHLIRPSITFQRIGRTTWVDSALYEIFNTVSEQLKEENFHLQTHDGIEFVLSGS